MTLFNFLSKFTILIFDTILEKSNWDCLWSLIVKTQENWAQKVVRLPVSQPCEYRFLISLKDFDIWAIAELAADIHFILQNSFRHLIQFGDQWISTNGILDFWKKMNDFFLLYCKGQWPNPSQSPLSSQKLSESYPNCMLCMSAFFTSKDVKIESRTADLWAHTRCMHDLAFPFKK